MMDSGGPYVMKAGVKKRLLLFAINLDCQAQVSTVRHNNMYDHSQHTLRFTVPKVYITQLLHILASVALFQAFSLKPARHVNTTEQLV